MPRFSRATQRYSLVSICDTPVFSTTVIDTDKRVEDLESTHKIRPIAGSPDVASVCFKKSKNRAENFIFLTRKIWTIFLHRIYGRLTVGGALEVEPRILTEA